VSRDTLSDLLRTVRLRGAFYFYVEDTLRDTDAKVLEIAIRVGYESETAFSRAFKRMVGETPGAWRRSHREQIHRNAMKTAANRLADSLPGPRSDT
jgi:transcriptional regulator GlxA family with amidase domain